MKLCMCVATTTTVVEVIFLEQEEEAEEIEEVDDQVIEINIQMPSIVKVKLKIVSSSAITVTNLVL